MTANHLPTGDLGDVYNGIPIIEDNRATVWEPPRRGEEPTERGLEELTQYMKKSYTDKGVQAVLFGVRGEQGLRYAVFVQPGFLTRVEAYD